MRDAKHLELLLIRACEERVRKRQRQDACLHARLSVTIYDEQRE